MLNIEIMDDEDLQDVTKKFISAILPHKDFVDSYFSAVLGVYLKYIKVEELTMEYRALISTLAQLRTVKTLKTGYIPKLRREVLDSILESNIDDMVLNKDYKVADYLRSNGEQYDFEIPTVFQEARSKLYRRCMELYDECYNMSIPTVEVLDYETVLSSNFEKHVIKKCVSDQYMLLQGTLKIGKFTYAGTPSWYSYVERVTNELKNRMLDIDSGMSEAVDSIDAEREALNALRALSDPLSPYGIPEYDACIQMYRHRFVVLAANPNVGKTMLAKHLAKTLILAGKKVLFICGETVGKQVWSEVAISYIFTKYGLNITKEEFADPEEYLDDEDCKTVKIARAELRDNNRFRFRHAIMYDNAYEDLRAEYELNEFDAVFLDHTVAMEGGKGDLQANIRDLSKGIRRFKVDYPVYCMVLSHLSADAKQQIDKGLIVTKIPTRDSQAPTTDCDDLFIMYANSTLDAQNLVGMQLFKQRGPKPADPTVYLRKQYEVSSLEYDELDQKSASTASAGAEEVLEQLKSTYDIID